MSKITLNGKNPACLWNTRRDSKGHNDPLGQCQVIEFGQFVFAAKTTIALLWGVNEDIHREANWFDIFYVVVFICSLRVVLQIAHIKIKIEFKRINVYKAKLVHVKLKWAKLNSKFRGVFGLPLSFTKIFMGVFSKKSSQIMGYMITHAMEREN